MRPTDKNAVRHLDLFAGMSGEAFDDLFETAYLQRFPQGIQLITEGDPADFLYVVLDGQVELFATWNGRETTMMVLQPVSTFILAAVLRDAVYLMSARTLEASRILMLPAEKIRSVMMEDAALAQAMIHELATCYRQTIMNLKNQKLRTSTDRLANFLLRLCQQQQQQQTVSLPFGKRTLASLLGMTPENLSRAFAALKLYGVEVNGRNIHFTRLEELKGFAKPDALIDIPTN